MRKSAVFILLIAGCIAAKSQDTVKVGQSFSHFYFVLDTLAYQTLKSNSFCKDSLFYTYESGATTDQGSWSANYLSGKYDYWEVMKPSKKDAIPAGSIGVGHMLHRLNDAPAFLQQWQALTTDSIELHFFTEHKGRDTIIAELMNFRDSMLTGGMACFFMMYYHPSIMKQSGFSDKTIYETGISQPAINKIWYGAKVEKKLYRKIERITLRLTPQEFRRHKIALQAWGYRQTGNDRFKKEIEIVVLVEKNPSHRLKEILFSLNRKTPRQSIILSPNANILLNGEEGRLIILK